jgi:CubicO group peptidase (beta-lactamase class C family)
MIASKTAHLSAARVLSTVGLVLALVSAISCGDEAPTEPPPDTVGPDGGTLSFAQGRVMLAIPAGALSEPVTIAVTSTSTFPHSATTVAGTAYEFGPPGTQFNRPVELTIAYDPADLPPGIRAVELGIFEVVGTRWQEVTDCSVNANRQSVTGSISSFSTYAVLGMPVTTLDITPDKATIVEGDTVRLNAEKHDARGNSLSERATTWSSSDQAVAVVDSSGLVTGRAEGNATITATSEAVDGTAEITVTPPSVALIEIEPDGGSIEVGQTLQLTAVLQDNQGDTLEGRSVTWSSSETSVATVSSSGLVTGIYDGSASITAECEGLSDAVEIIVSAPALRTVLDSIRASYSLPALAAATVHKGKVMEMGAIGHRAVGYPEQVTENDLWHMGSLTKAMTATLVAVLVERGVVSWDTTVGQVLPDLVGSIREEFVDVRLEELLYHTAGLEQNMSKAPSWSSLFTDQSPIIEQRRRFAAELLALPPGSERGTYSYTNAGYIVAGAMLEEITGESWETLVRREVFDPLGMSSTGFGAPGSPGSRDHPLGHNGSAGNYQPVAPGPYADNPAALGPAGTVHTTLADYSKFMIEHLAGAVGQGQLVSAQSFEKLHTPAPGSNYAMGWVAIQRSWANGRVLTHNGSNLKWYAVVWLAPERDVGFFAVTNAADSAARLGTDAAVGKLIRRFEASVGSGQ